MAHETPDDRTDDLWSAAAENDLGPIMAAGPVPEGHEGVYWPTDDEILAGVKRAAEADLRLAQARASRAEDRMRTLFEREVDEGQPWRP